MTIISKIKARSLFTKLLPELKKVYFSLKKKNALCIRLYSDKPLICRLRIKAPKQYLQVSFETVDSVINSQSYSISKFYVEDRIGEGKFIQTRLREMSSFVSKTQIVLLKIRDRNFSFRSNFLMSPECNILGSSKKNGEKFVKSTPAWNSVFFKPNRKVLKGTVAYLSNNDSGNYYHWMTLTLPLLDFYNREVGLENIDWFYVGKLNSKIKKRLLPFQADSLRKLGIPENKIIHDDCTGDQLLTAFSNPNLCFGGHHISSDSYKFVRNVFLNNLNTNSKEKTRIYVSRGDVNRRKVIDESKAIDLLSVYGFTEVSMDNLSVNEQAELFNKAEAIVSPHGAALTNLLFVEEKTKVIELLPYGYTNNCFFVLANYAKAEYFYLQGKNINQVNVNENRKLDIDIDLDRLKTVCQIANL